MSLRQVLQHPPRQPRRPRQISLASTSTGVDCSTTDSFDLWPLATTCTFDPMHVFYVSGIVNFELHLLIGCIHTKLGLGYPELHEACQVAWVWPRWVSATCVKDIFTARRARHNHESFRASASELLACCPIVRLWLHSVVVPTGVAREQVQSCLALFAVLDLVDSLKFDFNPDVALELQRAVEHFLGLHAVAYGEEGMQPKHHMAHHIAPQILRDGMYMDCFTMERKNKAIKSCASHHCRPDHKFEASVLGRVLVEQADQLLQCSHPGLRDPQRDPEVAAALGVASCSTSDTMRCGRRKLSAGMVAFFSRQALLVQACVEADGVLLALGEPLVQCPSPSETASTWQRGRVGWWPPPSRVASTSESVGGSSRMGLCWYWADGAEKCCACPRHCHPPTSLKVHHHHQPFKRTLPVGRSNRRNHQHCHPSKCTLPPRRSNCRTRQRCHPSTFPLGSRRSDRHIHQHRHANEWTLPARRPNRCAHHSRHPFGCKLQHALQ